MQSCKLSVSLSSQCLDFLNAYQEQNNCKSRSDVIQRALRLLQQQQLMAEYKAANREIDITYDVTTSDGLDSDETW